jgi:hypothetical protein
MARTGPQFLALARRKLIGEDGPELPDDESTEEEQGYCMSPQEQSLNGNEYNQVPFQGRNSTGHAGNVRRIENRTTRLPIQAAPRKVVTA